MSKGTAHLAPKASVDKSFSSTSDRSYASSEKSLASSVEPSSVSTDKRRSSTDKQQPPSTEKQRRVSSSDKRPLSAEKRANTTPAFSPSPSKKGVHYVESSPDPGRSRAAAASAAAEPPSQVGLLSVPRAHTRAVQQQLYIDDKNENEASHIRTVWGWGGVSSHGGGILGSY